MFAEHSQSDGSGGINVCARNVATAQSGNHRTDTIGKADAERFGRLAFEQIGRNHCIADSLWMERKREREGEIRRVGFKF